MNKQRIGLLLLGLVGLALVGSGLGKVINAPEAAQNFGSPSAPYILAIAEFITVAALLLPRTRLLGVLLAASYFGGATAFAWLHAGETPVASLALLVLLYAGTALYRPWLTDNQGATAMME